MLPGAKCPPGICFNPCLAEQHCLLSSFLHFSSAMRCMEYCPLVIVGPLMILIGYGLWQLLKGSNSVGSHVSEDLSLWDRRNSYSSLSCWNFCMALWCITVIINKVKNVLGKELWMHLAGKNGNDWCFIKTEWESVYHITSVQIFPGCSI